jgi:hypothetical protein
MRLMSDGRKCSLALLATAWDGSNWSTVAVPVPAGAQSTMLNAVSCTSPTNCTAVGSYTNRTGVQLTLAARWDGVSWSVQTTPSPPGSRAKTLNAVSCPSSTTCTAVGQSNDHTLVESWNGSAWTIQGSPMPGRAVLANLTGVSCTSPTVCTAVGSFATSANTDIDSSRPLVERYS